MDKPKLIELVDSDILQEMQELFMANSKVTIGIADYDNKYLTDNCHGKLSDFCEKYIKCSEEGRKRCFECDAENAKKSFENGRTVAYNCHAGLIDFMSPISVEGEMYGYIAGGQLSLKPLDKEIIDEIAEKYSIDKAELYEASKNITMVTEEQLNDIIVKVDKIAKMISHIATSKLKVIKASEEVEAAAKMKSDFLANMSHEIRTPMNAIIGMADMALRQNLSSEARSYVTQIKHSSKSLLSIINDILDFSKIESGKMDITLVEYSPINMINDIANILKTRIGDKPVELILDVAADLPGELMGDDNRIKQIITNIANNAVKFTNEGEVKITAYSEATGPNTYDLTVKVKDTGIGIKKENLEKIFDSFQQVDSKRNRNIEGTGLGLAISRQLVALMGGKISVESEYGVGSTFSFTVPQLALRQVEQEKVTDKDEVKVINIVANKYVSMQLESDVKKLGGSYYYADNNDIFEKCIKAGAKYIFAQVSDMKEEYVKVMQEHPEVQVVVLLDFNEEYECTVPNAITIRKPLYIYNIVKLFNHEDVRVEMEDSDAVVTVDFEAPDAKVLIVDDNNVNLIVAAGLMEPMNMQVDTAISGIKAIDMISEKHYDIIFMDHMMPQMDGVETTHIIRRMHPEYDCVPIIALTANAMEEAKSMFLVEGMNDFIAKPIDVKSLIKMLRTWLPADKIIDKEAGSEVVVSKEREKLIIPDLDVDAAIELVGNQDLYLKVLTNYYNSIDKNIDKIMNSYESEEWNNYTIEVHALKSSSRQIGAMELGSMAANLEQAGKDLNIDLIKAETEKLIKEYQRIGTIIAPYTSKEEETVKEPADTNVTAEIFEKMMNAIDELDSTALEDYGKELKKYNYEDEEQELIDKLVDAVDGLDMDTCETLINMWRETYL